MSRVDIHLVDETDEIEHQFRSVMRRLAGEEQLSIYMRHGWTGVAPKGRPSAPGAPSGPKDERLIDPAAFSGPLVVATKPTVTMAAIAIPTAMMRQKVSLRRILRRSTITSESSDIEFLQKTASAFCIGNASKALFDYINCDAI